VSLFTSNPLQPAIKSCQLLAFCNQLVRTASRQFNCRWHAVCNVYFMKKAWLFLVILVTVAVALALLREKREATVKEAVRSHLEYNYTFEKKDVFISDASDDLVEMNGQINQLSALAAMAGESVKSNAQRNLMELRDQRTTLVKKLEVLKNAKATNWNDLKLDYQKADSETQSSLRKTWQLLTGKYPS
jgi:hypothetical protein